MDGKKWEGRQSLSSYVCVELLYDWFGVFFEAILAHKKDHLYSPFFLENY